jgi:hypothetical protein
MRTISKFDFFRVPVQIIAQKLTQKAAPNDETLAVKIESKARRALAFLPSQARLQPGE